MKKLFTLAIMAVMAVAASAQMQLTKEMFNIYNGTPTSAVITTGPQTATVTFDPQGRVTSVEAAGMAISYDWAEDGKSVNVKAGNEGTVVTIDEWTPEHLKYSAEGVDFDVTLRPNRSVDTFTMTQGSMSMSQEYVYDTPEALYPSKIVISQGPQNMEVAYTVDTFDAEGNATSITQTIFGQNSVTTLDITY